MNAIIVSGSPSNWVDYCKLKNSNNYIIGVDRGTLTLLENGITPTLAIGDFDSVTSIEFERIGQSGAKVIKLNPEKDETDTEIAILEALELPISSIEIYGGLGGRMDHTLANIRLLLKFAKKGVIINLINEVNQISVLRPGNHQFGTLKYKYLSFFALEKDVENLSLIGVKYPLNHYLLRQDDIRCISNEILSKKFEVSFSEGFLLMVNSRD